MSPPVSVIIRTKNEAGHLGKVLQRLKEQEYGGSVEVVLVDSGSTDATVRIAESFHCRVLRMKPDEFSFGGALNAGIEEAKGEITIHLSGHSVPEGTDYLRRMVEPFEDDAVAATFGRDIPWPDTCPSQARDILNHFPESGPDGNKFSNANAAVRRAVWEMHRFDERLAACEDLFWAREVMSRGFVIRYIPRARVFHSHSSSPWYYFERYRKERCSLKNCLNLPDKTIRDVCIDWKRQVKTDFGFARERGYGRKWYLHIPVFRLAQELGLYFGSRTAR